jgi:hypothetical protein
MLVDREPKPQVILRVREYRSLRFRHIVAHDRHIESHDHLLIYGYDESVICVVVVHHQRNRSRHTRGEPSFLLCSRWSLSATTTLLVVPAETSRAMLALISALVNVSLPDVFEDSRMFVKGFAKMVPIKVVLS